MLATQQRWPDLLNRYDGLSGHREKQKHKTKKQDNSPLVFYLFHHLGVKHSQIRPFQWNFLYPSSPSLMLNVLSSFHPPPPMIKMQQLQFKGTKCRINANSAALLKSLLYWFHWNGTPQGLRIFLGFILHNGKNLDYDKSILYRNCSCDVYLQQYALSL